MKSLIKKRTLLVSAIALSMASTYFAASNLRAANWTGTSGGSASWGAFNTASPIAGWDDPVGFPNSAGAVAQFVSPIDTANAVTTQDTAGSVTVGTINYGNNNDMGNFSWTITNTNGITLDQVASGVGVATISNSSTNAGANNSLIIGGTGALNLADNLQILNTTTGSTAVNGAIQIGSVISGTGNITINSSQLIDPAVGNAQAQGAVRLTGVNTFVGDTTVVRGLVAFNTATAFGNAANIIRLGTVGGTDNVTVVRQGTAAITMANNIDVASGNSGVITFGSVHTANVAITYNGNIALGSTLNLTGAGTVNTAAINFNGQITGTGGIRKVGPGYVQVFNANNTYTGDTIVAAGNYVVAGANSIPDGVGFGNVIVESTGTLHVGSSTGETINGLSGSGAITATNGGSSSRTLTIGNTNASSTFAGTLKEISTRRLNIGKVGTGTLTLSGTNTFAGTTTITEGTIQYAKRVSFYNGNAAALPNLLVGAGWTATQFRVNSTGTAAYNVGGTDEFIESDIATIQSLGAGTNDSGFGNGSSIGLDTTNAIGGEFIYTSPIVNTFAGANSIGLKKLGTNTLTLTATSTYTGNTTVSGGTLNITGNHTTGANYSVASGANLVTKNVRVTNALTVGGTATITANGGTAGASKVETLTISAGGKLNLKDNDLVVGTAPNFDAVRTAIIAGKTNNAAAGITSDMTGFGISRGFGYAMGNDPKVSSLLAGSLAGQTFDTDSVLVKYTLLGDADLDGDTDLNDLGLWSNGYTGDLGVTTSPTTFWTGGDFDYDGDTDLNDLGLWSSTYTGDFNGGPGSLVVSAPGASPEAVAILNGMGFTVVPEPSTFMLAGVGLTGLAIASRRRRK